MVLGGWNSNFTFTYNLPSSSYLRSNSDLTRFQLSNVNWFY
jgi:hypothetical protein